MRSNNNNNIQPAATQGLSKEDLDRLVQELEVCAERGKNRGKQPFPSICKVSRILREPSKSPFDPQLVSIGLVHREDPKLQEFEWLKECYLNDLLNRCHDSTQKETLDACLNKVNDLIPQIRKSYAAVIENDKLAMMMVMDGCFILEFCLKHQDKENEYLRNKMQNLRTPIAMDLMLLENQVPFSVLQALFDCSMGNQSFTLSDVLDNCLAPYIKLFRSNLLPEKNSILSNILDKYLAPYIKRFCSLLPEKIPTTDVESDLHKKISTTDVESDLHKKIPTTDVESDLHKKIPTTDVESDLHKKISTTDVDSDSTHDHVLGYLHKHYQPVVAESSNRIHAGILWCSVNFCKKPRILLNAPGPKQLCSSFCKNFRKCTCSNCVLAPSLHEEASKHVDEEQAAKSSNPIPPDAEASKPVNEELIEIKGFHSIEELDRSGVNFKPHQEDEWSMTIKFQSSVFAWLPFFWKPTLLMPTLVIEDFTELILRNFIAYEQSFPQDHYYFTSYAYAMDMSIDTKEDIAKLVDSKVLVNRLGSNQEAADMINEICKNVLVKKFCYTEEFKQMDEYYNGYWPKNIARLRRIYFSNPWSTITLVAAIILFCLTVVQTVFTILEYFR